MSSSFPTSLDSFTDPQSGDKQNSPNHVTQHQNENDAIEKLEAKVGVDNSTVTTSLDYKVRKGLGINSATDGTTITFDMASKNIHTVTLGGDRTLAVTNVSVGQSFIIRLVQDATGSRTVTWWSGISWPSGTAPTLSTAAGAVDVFGFICTSTDHYDGFFMGFELEEPA